jgi:hypothetical protein
LVYSKHEDAGYCLPCLLFRADLTGAGQLVRIGMTNFKSAGRILQDHMKEHHTCCMNQADEFVKRYETGRSVMVAQAALNIQTVLGNRAFLKPICKCLIFCGRQALALRGHDEPHHFTAPGYHIGKRAESLAERKSGTDRNFVNDNVAGMTMVPSQKRGALRSNKGNFLALLDFRIDSGDRVLQAHVEHSDKHTTYVSPQIQNVLILILGTRLLATILKPLLDAQHAGSCLGFFAVLADEASDAANLEQMTVVLRFLAGGVISELSAGSHVQRSTVLT